MMDPEAADQVTLLLTLPVPVTAAVHWLVWPGSIEAGTQETLTEVIDEDWVVVEVKLPPLHPATHNMLKKMRLSAALRSISIRLFVNRNGRGCRLNLFAKNLRPESDSAMPRRFHYMCNECSLNRNNSAHSTDISHSIACANTTQRDRCGLWEGPLITKVME